MFSFGRLAAAVSWPHRPHRISWENKKTMKPCPTAKRTAAYRSPLTLELLKNFPYGGSAFSCLSSFTNLSARLGVQLTNRRQQVSCGWGTPIYERYRALCLMKQLALEIDPLWHIMVNIGAK